MDFLKSTLKQEIFSAVLYGLLGIFFIAQPGLAFITIGKILSIGMLVIGISMIALYFREKSYVGVQNNGLAIGLIIVFVSLYFLIRADDLAKLIGFLIGFLIIISGIMQFQSSLNLMHFKVSHWAVSLVSSVIMVVLGIIALLYPFKMEKTLILVSGIFILVCSLFKILTILLLMYGARSIQKSEEAMDVTESAVVITTPAETTGTKDNAN